MENDTIPMNCLRSSKVLQELHAIEKKLEEVKKDMGRLLEAVDPEEFGKGEYDNLMKKAQKTHMFLSALIVCSIATAVILLLDNNLLGSDSLLKTILIGLSCGVTGSSLSALISSLQRQANGFESRNGVKYPEAEPKDKFNERMTPFFWYRPVLGLVAAFLIFLMIQSGMISIEGLNRDFQIAFYSVLAGLFAKTLFEKLKDLFKSFFYK